MAHTLLIELRPTLTRRAPVAAAAVFSAMVLGFMLLGSASASAITRNGVLERAQTLVDSPVTYSQSAYHLGYRTDCSGYVSMCWKTGTSWATSSFYNVTHPITTSALLPGDAMLKKGYHIRLFYGWVDDAHTQYVAYESSNGQVAQCRIRTLADDIEAGYIPTRYDSISKSPTSSNLLKNGDFDTWSKSWSSTPDKPVWWTASGSTSLKLVTAATSTYRTATRSLKLTNPSKSSSTYTQLTQSTAVDAGTNYQLAAWVKTANGPEVVELSLAYLDADGGTLAEASTGGAQAYLNDTDFKRMAVTLRAPADTAKALVTVRLAGSTSTDSSGIVSTGSTAYLDDLSLYRPYVKSTITRSTSTATSGTKLTLRGVVTPKSAIGETATTYIKRPGSTWEKLSSTTVYSSDGLAKWKSTFTFKSSMTKGTYSFKTRITGVSGYLSSTTDSVSVKLK